MNPDAPEHSDMVVSFNGKCEPEEVSTPLVIAESEFDLDLDKGHSSPMNNLEEDHSRSYARKVIAEIPDREIDIEVANSVRNNSVNPETQVFDEMFQPVSTVKYSYGHFVIFTTKLTQSCMLTSSNHNQPIDSDIFDYFSELGHAKLILFLHQFPREQFKLYFPFDPGSSFLTTYLGALRICVFWDVLGALSSMCFGPMQRLLFGPIGFSVNLLNNAPDMDEDARLGMAKHLGWLLCIITDEDVYFYVLLEKLTAISLNRDKLDKLWFHRIRKALKTLLMVSSSRHSLCAN